MTKITKTILFGLMFMSAVGARADFANLQQDCINDLKKFPGAWDDKLLTKACEKAKVEALCVSAEGRPIYHYDKISSTPGAKKVLVFSLIHGDETPAGTVGRYWMERLEGIDPRNSWRVIPVLNPDGVKYKTRTNANKIDINRNFPTKDWETGAIENWKRTTKSNPRRFPGEAGGSEPETKCALYHLEDFQPDFIVSVHTPLKVLDFDGPKVAPPPKFDYLPWKSLGNYPGSLGRYMWLERQTPVLTMELKESLPPNLSPFEKLQDIIGSLVKLETGKTKANTAASPTSFLPVALEH
ncbi:MAG: carboxypeptidase [Bdellovibrio sp. ArHS]|uniref:M14 family zinc carboxypeptidase n=1 Tax=Bdellovibrio sp. ArHS TaxID=1569284 RepID=UPI0005825B97|nr:M14 family zinc carboxypeptidase [Bdellovibrio sp. ArHS]KHD88702.1 MAG: carboxypeptidase [Bdellovibrio sp. ArHS]